MQGSSPTTRGESHFQPPHRSLWRAGLERRAHGVPLDDWLVEQANKRGWYGAYQARPSDEPLDPALTPEEIIVGLAQPHAPADVRTLKLIVRILQAGVVDPDRLRRLARRERADFVLHWLLVQVPGEERTPPLERVAAEFREPPRGYRPPRFRWDPRRLIRRPARFT